MSRPRPAVVAAAALALCATGCTSLARQTARAAATSPWALAAGEQRLRDALVAHRWDDAWRASTSPNAGGPTDALLRDLYAGTVAYYAGRWDSTTTALDRASTLADDRYTRSVSRGALALATNDLALPYVPGQNERLLLHYYALLAWLRRNRPDDALVEARRIAQMLAEYDDDRNALDASTRAMLHALAGAVFERAGAGEDAAVAYRRARVLRGGALPWDSARASIAADGGDVLVVVEQGFVAHRVEQRLVVRGASDVSARAAALFAGDDGVWADGPVRELDAGDHAGPVRTDDSTHAPRPAVTRVRIAWPAFRRPAAFAPAHVIADDAALGDDAATLRASLSDAVAGDFRRDRGARLTRLLVRATAHAAAVSEVARKHKDLGSLLGTVSNAVERADTRSWQLLPGIVSITRLRLPVGMHAISVDVDGTRRIVDSVRIERGGLAFATTRVWPGAPALVAASSAAR